MGVHEGQVQLAEALKQLRAKWDTARGAWNDARAKEFEDRYVRPLESDARAAMTAMNLMAGVLGQIRRDCG